MRDIQQKKEENKGDLNQFCMWMNNFAHKIKRLITYSRETIMVFRNKKKYLRIKLWVLLELKLYL